jgi:hypothetical protein
MVDSRRFVKIVNIVVTYGQSVQHPFPNLPFTV